MLPGRAPGSAVTAWSAVAVGAGTAEAGTPTGSTAGAVVSGSGLGSGGLAPTDIRGWRPTCCCSFSSQVVSRLIPTTVDIAIAAPENLRVGSRNRPPTGFGRPCRPTGRIVLLSSRSTTGLPSLSASHGRRTLRRVLESTSGGYTHRQSRNRTIATILVTYGARKLTECPAVSRAGACNPVATLAVGPPVPHAGL